MPIAILAIALGSVSLNALAQIMLRRTMLTVGALPAGAADLPEFTLRLLFNGFFLAGMLSYVLSIGAWLVVLSKTEVSAAYPLLSIGYVITAIVGFAFMGEHVTLTRVAGIAVICIGLFLITRSA
ncbi:MAG TPA: EamA family transporter [Rhizomicrobium sp.]|nr:EamA family transporter [Rhizomicrobium sp.]